MCVSAPRPLRFTEIRRPLGSACEERGRGGGIPPGDPAHGEGWDSPGREEVASSPLRGRRQMSEPKHRNFECRMLENLRLVQSLQKPLRQTCTSRPIQHQCVRSLLRRSMGSQCKVCDDHEKANFYTSSCWGPCVLGLVLHGSRKHWE
jgi:hypothetical protein